MANHIRVTLEIGPQGKKVAAVAPDWPGLERGAATGEAAIERLLAYVPRYATVAKLAGIEPATADAAAAAFSPAPEALTGVDVVEQYRAPAQPISGVSRSRFRASTGKP